jgi:hypothetical protein
MPAFQFDRRQLRRTARVTLVVWLFALVAGVVNACALTPDGSAGRGVAPASHVEIAEHAAAEDAYVVAGHVGDHGHDADKANCLKFCDDGSSAIAKVPLPVADPGAGPVSVVDAWSPMAAIGSSGFQQALERTGSQGPPLVIRFLRLTL